MWFMWGLGVGEERKADRRAVMLASWEGLEREAPQWVGCRKAVWLSMRRRQVVGSWGMGGGIFFSER